jgi:hypothetical protein
MKEKFIAVGENIHCTRIYKVGGLYVKSVDGQDVILFGEKAEKQTLPIPRHFLETADWENGKIKHTAAAIWQGMNGKTGEERRKGRAYLQFMTSEQETNAASFLDLNVDEYSTDVEERCAVIQWAAEAIQEVSHVPLSIDSSNTIILAAGLEACDAAKGKPMVNSVSLERQEAVGIARNFDACVIASAAGETRMPGTAEERLANIAVLSEVLEKAGFAEQDIYLDPLVFPVSVDPQNGKTVLHAIKALRDRYGKTIHFAPGLSNISFGMPKRKLINQVFTYLARENGADGGIVDPGQINSAILDAMDPEEEPFRLAKELLMGEDEFGMNFIGAVRSGRL